VPSLAMAFWGFAGVLGGMLVRRHSLTRKQKLCKQKWDEPGTQSGLCSTTRSWLTSRSGPVLTHITLLPRGEPTPAIKKKGCRLDEQGWMAPPPLPQACMGRGGVGGGGLGPPLREGGGPGPPPSPAHPLLAIVEKSEGGGGWTPSLACSPPPKKPLGRFWGLLKGGGSWGYKKAGGSNSQLAAGLENLNKSPGRERNKV